MSRFNEIAAEIIDVTENVMRAGQRPGAWTFVVDAGGKLPFMFLD